MPRKTRADDEEDLEILYRYEMEGVHPKTLSMEFGRSLQTITALIRTALPKQKRKTHTKAKLKSTKKQ